MRNKTNDYIELIKSFDGKIVPFPAMKDDSVKTGRRIYIRHDVDKDIDKAVKMALEEKKAGIISTYFILNTATYFDNDISRQLNIIKDCGHEIGWHNNALSEFYVYKKGKELKTIVEDDLSLLRDKYGCTIRGSASHGDDICKELKFLNYHIFDIPGMKFQRFVRHTDHPIFNMADFGLEYEAYFIRRNYYLSDSGDSWSLDPKEVVKKFNEQENSTIQLLIHPDWWI